MRSSFLHSMTDWGKTIDKSQSLLNEVFFPTERGARNWHLRPVAIPSKWGLLSYLKIGGQWYAAAVAIPSKWGLLSYGGGYMKKELFQVSQSLLNEVFFPTQRRISLASAEVAIPSKWGLLSYPPPIVAKEIPKIAGVAIPSKWGLLSYMKKEKHLKTTH